MKKLHLPAHFPISLIPNCVPGEFMEVMLLIVLVISGSVLVSVLL